MAKQWLRRLWYASTRIHECKQCGGKGDDCNKLDRDQELGRDSFLSLEEGGASTSGGWWREPGLDTLIWKALTEEAMDKGTFHASYDSLSKAEAEGSGKT
jgi:hypothetical protein